MARKSNANVEPRTQQQILIDINDAEATCVKIRLLLAHNLSAIRSSRFKEYVWNSEGKLVSNPVLKRVREYEGTLRSISRHIAALFAERDALVCSSKSDRPELDEFAV